MLQPGDAAPDFTLPDQHGNPVALSELRGSTVVLYFYPRADTPGCTTQACGIRDHTADYERAGARVIGVSPDPPRAVSGFADKHGLEYHPNAMQLVTRSLKLITRNLRKDAEANRLFLDVLTQRQAESWLTTPSRHFLRHMHYQ